MRLVMSLVAGFVVWIAANLVLSPFFFTNPSASAGSRLIGGLLSIGIAIAAASLVWKRANGSPLSGFARSVGGGALAGAIGGAVRWDRNGRPD